MSFIQFFKLIKYPIVIGLAIGIIYYLQALFVGSINSFEYFLLQRTGLFTNIALVLITFCFWLACAWAGYIAVKFRDSYIYAGFAGAITNVLAFIIPTTIFFIIILAVGPYGQGNSIWNGFAYNTGLTFLLAPFFGAINGVSGFVLGVAGGFVARRKLQKKAS